MSVMADRQLLVRERGEGLDAQKQYRVVDGAGNKPASNYREDREGYRPPRLLTAALLQLAHALTDRGFSLQRVDLRTTDLAELDDDRDDRIVALLKDQLRPGGSYRDMLRVLREAGDVIVVSIQLRTTGKPRTHVKVNRDGLVTLRRVTPDSDPVKVVVDVLSTERLG